MKSIAILGSFLLFSITLVAQTRTITGSGNWSNSGSWLGGNIGGGIDNDDDVVMQNNIDITVQNGEAYTIATLNVSKDGSLTIDLGGILTVTGTVNVDKDFTINVDGDLIIQGDLGIAKSLQLNVTGNLTVLGDVNLAKDAQVDVQGSVAIGGDFTSAKDAQVNVDGTLDVTGDLGLGSGSVISGGGTVTAGSCSGAACGSVLPIELLFFQAKSRECIVNLSWATATEENFDYFAIERSVDGVNFKEMARLHGVGESTKRVDYEYTDEFPLIGRSYYRLRSIDFDGYTEIFDYKMVEVEGVKNDFAVFPNPIANKNFSLQTNFDLEEAAELIIYNNMGSVEQRISVNDWLATYAVDNLQPGNYLFKLVSSQGVMVKRIVIE